MLFSLNLEEPSPWTTGIYTITLAFEFIANQNRLKNRQNRQNRLKNKRAKQVLIFY